MLGNSFKYGIGLLTACMFILIFNINTTSGVVYQFVDAAGTLNLTNKKPRGVKYKVIYTPSRRYRSVNKSTIKKVKGIIHSKARKYNIDPYLIEALAQAESGFNPKAVSPKGACGVMQLMPATAKRYGLKNDIFDVDMNIETGIKYLKDLMERFDNNIALTIAAYNAGETRVEQCEGIPPFKETRAFVRKVIKRYSELSGKKVAYSFDYKKPPQTSKPPKPIRKYVTDDGVVVLTNK